MSKITRKNQKIFGTSAGFEELAVIGSLADNSPAFSTDVETIQSLANYETGWFGVVLGNNSPAIEDMNSLCYVYAYQLTYLFQSGIPEWNTSAIYYKGSIVTDGNGFAYKSLTDDNTGNSITSTTNWIPFDPFSSDSVKNFSMTAAVAANALTITVKDPFGATPSDVSPVSVGFRSATATDGGFSQAKINAASTITIPSGTTIGSGNNVPTFIYVYLMLNDSGTPVLGVSMVPFDEGTLQTSSAISGGAQKYTLYTTAALTSRPIRLVGRITITEVTAGTWATGPTEVSPLPFDIKKYLAKAGGNPASASSGNPIIFPSEVYDTYNCYDTSTGIFETIIQGYYRVSGYIKSANSNVSITVYSGGSPVTSGVSCNTDSNGAAAFSQVFFANVGASITIRPNGTLDADGDSNVTFEYIGS